MTTPTPVGRGSQHPQYGFGLAIQRGRAARCNGGFQRTRDYCAGNKTSSLILESGAIRDYRQFLAK